MSNITENENFTSPEQRRNVFQLKAQNLISFVEENRELTGFHQSEVADLLKIYARVIKNSYSFTAESWEKDPMIIQIAFIFLKEKLNFGDVRTLTEVISEAEKNFKSFVKARVDAELERI
jgi:hypothetical protein